MKLLELFVTETTEEDRALVPLSSAIYKTLIQPQIDTDIDYTDEDRELLKLGKIGDHFDTPFTNLNDINIEIQGGVPFTKRIVGLSDPTRMILAAWDYDTNSIVFNQDYLDADRIPTVVTHELRHALDDKKSNGKAGHPDNAYARPRKREYARDKEESYKARRDEINARFTEVMHIMMNLIPKRIARYGSDNIMPQLQRDLNALLMKYEILQYFPERTASPDFKRLIKRAMDMITKELNHIASQQSK